MSAPSIRFSVSYPRTVLFDFEGTLVDFQWDLRGGARAAKHALAALGYPVAEWEDNYAVLWNNAVATAAQRGLDARIVARSVDAVYEPFDLEALSRWSLAPGVREALLGLRRQQIQVGLVTNIGQRAMDQALTKFGLDGQFDIVITRADVELLKPCGDGIRLAIEKLRGDPSSALFVGDSVTDVLAARDAGIAVAIVRGGESDVAAIRAAGATFIVSDFTQLQRVVAGCKW